MKRALRTCILLAASAVLVFAADLTGTWIVNVEVTVGSGSPTFKLKQNGEKLTGDYEGQLGTAKIEGTVTGNNVEMWFTVSDVKVTYKGTIDGPDKMRGEAHYGGQASGTWTAKRK